MYEYIKGELTGLTPAGAIVETNGIGYFIHVSINTYSKITGKQQIKLFLHQVVREDAHLLYGFADADERELFKLLISVSGIGAGTAIMMLSSYQTDELKSAIYHENVSLLKGIKGIGIKTAQRVIIDLKDKVGQTTSIEPGRSQADLQVRDEALAALEMLGFTRKAIEKGVDQIVQSQPGLSVEQVLKIALKRI